MFDVSNFLQFISPQCDRKSFIINYLRNNGVKAVVMPIENKNHIYVVFPKESYNSSYKIKTVLIHYDRVENSPGANDNSIAVFLAMEWACRLNKITDFHNVRLIFTDGEELSEQGVTSQGAYSLASVFKRLKITNDDVYVFDCVGRGTVPVISDCIIPQSATKLFQEKYYSLKNRTHTLLQSVCENVYFLPVSYSDNGGFLACGIPAVAITFLPTEEATLYIENLKQNPELKEYVMNKKNKESKNLESMLPHTWKLFHTPNDNFDSLTEESFYLMEKILNSLAFTNSK